jgi:hypothetical protein
MTPLPNEPLKDSNEIPLPEARPLTFNGVQLTFNEVPLVFTGEAAEDVKSEPNVLDRVLDNVSDHVFITLDHDGDDFQSVISLVGQLSDNVRGSNELFADSADRLCVLSEINVFRSLLEEPKVRLKTVLSFVTGAGTIGWLAREAASSVVRNYALELVKAIYKLLEPFLPWVG